MVDVASLLVSELVANSVLHAGTPMTVVLSRNARRLRVEVQDGDPRLPARKHYSSLATTGRGLMLVERLAADWGVRPTANGKGVWFELDQAPTVARQEVGVPDLSVFDLDSIDPLGGDPDAPRGRSWRDVGRPRPGPGRRPRPPVRVRVGAAP